VVALADVSAAVRDQTGKELATVKPELAAALFEGYLEDEVVLAAGGTQEDSLPLADRGARVRELLARLCPPPPRPTAAQVEAYLAAHPELAPHADRLLLRQLILPDQNTALLARRRLLHGDDFATMSRELSHAPNAAQGGMLGWVERGQLPPEFEAAVVGLPSGGISEPVPSNAGWHLFQVMEKRPAGSGADSETRRRARETLASRDAEALRKSCLRRLALGVGVQVDCRDAPFPCHNPFEETP
jgi:hypothetical protein